MFEADDIRDWIGQTVVDLHANKIGSLEAIYFDTATDEPLFGTVKVGLPGRTRLIFVPLKGATVAPKHLRVLADKNEAKEAPSIDIDGELGPDAEAEIFGHYRLPYQRGASGERRLGRR